MDARDTIRTQEKCEMRMNIKEGAALMSPNMFPFWHCMRHRTCQVSKILGQCDFKLGLDNLTLYQRTLVKVASQYCIVCIGSDRTYFQPCLLWSFLV